MKPVRIFLVRHGQSVGNVNKEIYKETPDYTVPLTDRGRQQATELGKHLVQLIGTEEPIQFYVSPFWRTRQTFLGIAHEFPANNIKYYEDPRLREQEWGQDLVARTGIHWDLEKQREEYGHFYFRFPDGESCADVFDRMSDFIGTLFRDFQKEDFPRNMVVVTHGMAMRLFVMRWFHCSVEEFESWGNPRNCQYLLLVRGHTGKYTLTTPMRLHKIRHEYQFKWPEYTTKYKQLGEPKVPYDKSSFVK